MDIAALQEFFRQISGRKMDYFADKKRQAFLEKVAENYPAVDDVRYDAGTSSIISRYMYQKGICAYVNPLRTLLTGKATIGVFPTVFSYSSSPEEGLANLLSLFDHEYVHVRQAKEETAAHARITFGLIKDSFFNGFRREKQLTACVEVPAYQYQLDHPRNVSPAFKKAIQNRFLNYKAVLPPNARLSKSSLIYVVT